MKMKTPTPSVAPFISTRRPLSRRHFLRGSGVVLALPAAQMFFNAKQREALADKWLGAHA